MSNPPFDFGLLPNQDYMAQQLAANPAASAAPARPPRLIDRLRSGTTDMLESMRRKLAPTPMGYEGLLSPDEIQQARPHILQSLIGTPDAPSPDERYRANLDGIIERRTAASGLARQQQMLAARAEIAQRFTPPAPGAPHGEQMSYLKSLYGAYAANGDTEMMGKVGEVLKSIGGEGTRPTLREVEALDENGKPIVALTDPYTGEIVRTMPREPKQTARDGLTPAQESSNQFRTYELEDRMAREFNSETDRHQVRAEAYSTLMGNRAEAERGNAAAQMALIFSYMRLLDPNSAVREGEYHKAEMLTGIPERVRVMFYKLRDGQFLDTAEASSLQRFYSSAQALVRSSMRDFDNISKEMSERAGKRGIDAKAVVKDYFRQWRSTLDGSGDAAPAGRRIAAPPGR